MKIYRIATIPGDGIGKEVVPAGQQVMQALADAGGTLCFEFENFDWGGDYYREHGKMMPDDGLDALRNNYLGVVMQSNWEYEKDFGPPQKSMASRLARSIRRNFKKIA